MSASHSGLEPKSLPSRRIAIIGDAGIGKLAFAFRFTNGIFSSELKHSVDEPYSERQPEFSYARTIPIDGENTPLEIVTPINKWEPIMRFGKTHPCRNARGVIIAFDLTDKESFNNLDYWFEEVRRQPQGVAPSIILVGLKSDLVSKRQVSREEAEQFAAKQGIPYMECSAKGNTNVDGVFTTLARNIRAAEPAINVTQDPLGIVRISTTPPKKTSLFSKKKGGVTSTSKKEKSSKKGKSKVYFKKKWDEHDKLSFFAACSNDKIDVVSEILRTKKIDINAKDSRGYTPLHRAVQKGSAEIVKLLLESKADIDTVNAQGNSLLHTAYKERHLYDILSILINAGIDTHATNAEGKTILDLLKEDKTSRSSQEYIKLVELAMRKQTPKLASSPAPSSAPAYRPLWNEVEKEQFFAACKSGDINYVRYIIANRAFNVNVADKNGFTPLHHACSKKGNLEIVKLLIEHGADATINSLERRGHPPLHFACDNAGDLEIVQYLVVSGANFDISDNSGQASLHWACWGGNADIAQWISEKGAKISTSTILRKSLLGRAIYNGNLEMTKWLVANLTNLDVDVDDMPKGSYDGSTPMHWACWSRVENIDLVRFLVQEKGLSINAKNNYNSTPLHDSCRSGHLETAKWLVANGADIYAKNNDGKTALDVAIGRGHKEVVQFLEGEIRRKGQPSSSSQSPALPLYPSRPVFGSGQQSPAPSYSSPRPHASGRYQTPASSSTPAVQFGMQQIKLPMHHSSQPVVGSSSMAYPYPATQSTPPSFGSPVASSSPARKPRWSEAEQKQFFEACKAGDIATLKRIAATRRIDVNANSGEYGNTPLQEACGGGKLDVAKWLFANGANIHSVDKYGYTTLRYACLRGHLETAKWLLANGANIHVTDKYSTTTLHSACGNGHLEVAKWLFANGANINAINNMGSTPLHEACWKGYLNVAKWLVVNGANINTVTKNGTPLHEACRYGCLDVAKWLVANGADIYAKHNGGKTALDLAKEINTYDSPETRQNKDAITSFLEAEMRRREVAAAEAEVQAIEAKLAAARLQAAASQPVLPPVPGGVMTPFVSSPGASMSSPVVQITPPADPGIMAVATCVQNLELEKINAVLVQENEALKNTIATVYSAAQSLVASHNDLSQRIALLEHKPTRNHDEERLLLAMRDNITHLNSQIAPLREEYNKNQAIKAQQDYIINHPDQNMRYFYLELRRELHSLMLMQIASSRISVKDNFTQSTMNAGQAFLSGGVQIARFAGEAAAAVPLIGGAIAVGAKITSFLYDKYTSEVQRNASKITTQSPGMLEGIESISDEVARLLTIRHEDQIKRLSKKETSSAITSKPASSLAKSMGRKIGIALTEQRIVSQSKSGAELVEQMVAVTEVFKTAQDQKTLLNIPTNREKRLKSATKQKKNFTDEGAMRKPGLKWLSHDGQTVHVVAPEGTDHARYGLCWAFGHQLQGVAAERSVPAASLNLDPAVVDVAKRLGTIRYVDPKVHEKAMKQRPASERVAKPAESRRDEEKASTPFSGTVPGLVDTVLTLQQQLAEERARNAENERRLAALEARSITTAFPQSSVALQQQTAPSLIYSSPLPVVSSPGMIPSSSTAPWAGRVPQPTASPTTGFASQFSPAGSSSDWRAQVSPHTVPSASPAPCPPYGTSPSPFSYHAASGRGRRFN